MAKQLPEEHQHPAVSREEGEEDSTALEGLAPAIPNEILDKLPPEDRKAIRKTFSAFFARYTGPMPSRTLSKINAQHITDIIGLADRVHEREHKSQNTSWRFLFAIFVISLVALVGLVVFFVIVGQIDLVREIVFGIGGVGAGYGIGRFTTRG